MTLFDNLRLLDTKLLDRRTQEIILNFELFCLLHSAFCFLLSRFRAFSLLIFQFSIFNSQFSVIQLFSYSVTQLFSYSVIPHHHLSRLHAAVFQPCLHDIHTLSKPLYIDRHLFPCSIVAVCQATIRSVE